MSIDIKWFTHSVLDTLAPKGLCSIQENTLIGMLNVYLVEPGAGPNLHQAVKVQQLYIINIFQTLILQFC